MESRLCNLVSKLSALHWRVLHRVLGFMLSLERQQEHNGMTRELLAHSFAPSLARGHLSCLMCALHRDMAQNSRS